MCADVSAGISRTLSSAAENEIHSLDPAVLPISGTSPLSVRATAFADDPGQRSQRSLQDCARCYASGRDGSRIVPVVSAPLDGKVALVAGATRGAGRGQGGGAGAVALGEAGATVYCTGRTTRERRSDYDRPETIEETAELVTAAGGVGIAVAVDHLQPDQGEGLVRRIDVEHGRLHVLVNDIWGGEQLAQWNTPVWEHDLADGLRLLRLAVDTHL